MTRTRLRNLRFEQLRFECQLKMREWKDNPQGARENADTIKHLSKITVESIRKELKPYSTSSEYQDLMERVNWAEQYLHDRCEELDTFTSFEALSPEGQAFFGEGEDKEYQEKTEPIDLPPFTFRLENMKQ